MGTTVGLTWCHHLTSAFVCNHVHFFFPPIFLRFLLFSFLYQAKTQLPLEKNIHYLWFHFFLLETRPGQERKKCAQPIWKQRLYRLSLRLSLSSFVMETNKLDCFSLCLSRKIGFWWHWYLCSLHSLLPLTSLYLSLSPLHPFLLVLTKRRICWIRWGSQAD